MPLKQFLEDEVPDSHRMTTQEARAVIDLWTQQQERPDVPSVNDVAEGLSIPPAEVEALLQQVRSQQMSAITAQSLPSGWKIVQMTPERAKSQAFWERITLTILLCVVTVGITIWTCGTAYTFYPSFRSPADLEWFIGLVDLGL